MASLAAARRTLAASSAPSSRRALTSLASATVPKRLLPPSSSSSALSSSDVALSLSASSVGAALRKRGLSGTSEVAKMDRETIIRLLHSLGTRTEVERYLRIFTSSTGAAGGASGVLPQAKFAVLKCVPSWPLSTFLFLPPCVGKAFPSIAFAELAADSTLRPPFLPARIGGAILTNELNDLALSLSFLNRLGLFPIVLHGAGPQLCVRPALPALALARPVVPRRTRASLSAWPSDDPPPPPSTIQQRAPRAGGRRPRLRGRHPHHRSVCPCPPRANGPPRVSRGDFADRRRPPTLALIVRPRQTPRRSRSPA